MPTPKCGAARGGATPTPPSSPFTTKSLPKKPAELIYHFDLYRLESVDDALEIGVEDYFDSGALCLLEWPERIEPLLPDDTVTVNVNVNPDMSRTMTVDIPD